MANGVLNPVLLRSISGNYAAIDSSGNVAVNGSVTANISGQSVFLGSGSVFGISGLPISFASGAGATLSGITTITSVTTNISGNTVYLASGFNQVREVGTTIINSSLSGAYIITGNSGGSVLFSGGPLISTTLRNASGNTTMFIGGLGTNAPATNVGIPLFANETLTLKVNNFNAISAMSTTSGQVLYYLGLQ